MDFEHLWVVGLRGSLILMANYTSSFDNKLNHQGRLTRKYWWPENIGDGIKIRESQALRFNPLMVPKIPQLKANSTRIFVMVEFLSSSVLSYKDRLLI